MLFAILKIEKIPVNCNLRKIHKQFGQRNTGEHHTADSEAFLPNCTQLVSLRATSLR